MAVETRPGPVDVQADESHVWTYADILAIPEDSSKRYEILEGELFVSPSPSVSHQLVVTELNNRLSRHAEAADLGLVLAAPVDIKRSEYEVAVPDIFFVRKARASIVRRGHQTIIEPPDMVVEVISPSS